MKKSKSIELMAVLEAPEACPLTEQLRNAASEAAKEKYPFNIRIFKKRWRKNQDSKAGRQLDELGHRKA